MSSNEAGFVLARRDYAGPGKEPQKDEVNGDAARPRPRFFFLMDPCRPYHSP